MLASAAPADSHLGTDEAGCPLYAGTISAPGKTDDFRFALDAGDRVGLVGHLCNHDLVVLGPNGAEVSAPVHVICGSLALSFEASAGSGDYTVRIAGSGDATGDYAIAFSDVTAPTSATPTAFVATTCKQEFVVPERVPIEAQTTVIDKDNCPTWHASISVPGQIDEFAFALSSGQKVGAIADVCNIDLTVLGSTGSQVLAPIHVICGRQNFSFQAIDGDGSYVLRVRSPGDGVSEYSMRFTLV